MQNNNQQQVYPRFGILQTVAKWAGAIGVIQSIIWIGLSITGLLYYMCVVENDSGKIINFGSIIGFMIQHLYFYNTYCADVSKIQYEVEPILTPSQINIWIWVYLVVSVFWFGSSVTLITHVNIKHLKRTNTILYVWVFIVLSQSAMDLSLGVIFLIDYKNFYSKASEYEFSSNIINPKTYEKGIIHLSGEISTFSMMMVVMRGFLLWIINVGLMIFFFKESFILNDAQAEQGSLIPQDFSSYEHPLQRRPPLAAYDTSRNEAVVGVTHENPGVTHENPISSLDAAAIERASKLSNAVLMSRKSRFADYEQYPADNNSNNQTLPVPDYSPYLLRNENNSQNPFVKRQNTNSFLKNQRYQSYLYGNNNNN